jgi:hypothetical protein
LLATIGCILKFTDFDLNVEQAHQVGSRDHAPQSNLSLVNLQAIDNLLPDRIHPSLLPSRSSFAPNLAGDCRVIMPKLLRQKVSFLDLPF